MINDLNEQHLKQLVLLLKPFRDMMIIIQRGNTPFLHLVSLCFITLKDVLNSYESLKEYNKERNEEEHDGRSQIIYDDEDIEHELEGKQK